MKKLLIVLLILEGLAGRGFSQQRAESEIIPESSPTEIHPQFKEYFVDILLPHLWEGTKASFSDQTIPYWALAGFSAGIAFTQDEEVRDFWKEHNPIGDWKIVGNTWGEGYTQAGVALSLWGTGWLIKDQKLTTTSEVLMEAEILNGIITTAMKEIVGRKRPDRSGNDSFPSGHTSASFCFASVIEDRYGPAWGIPAYALAIFTGLSRMESDVHWLSDVVMGAGLGMIIGYSVSKAHDDWPYENRWHRTEKNLLKQAQIIPILPENEKDELGLKIYLPLN